MGQHYLDPTQYLLDKDDESPVSVEVDTPPQHYDAVLPWRRVELTYADGCKIVLDGEDREKGAADLSGPNGQGDPGFRTDPVALVKKFESFPAPEPPPTKVV